MDNEIIQPESMDVINESSHREIKKTIKINVKAIVVAVVVVGLVVLGYTYRGLFVAAMVDGSPISRLLVVQKLEKTSGKSLLNNLIVEKLIQNEAKAKKITISNEEIDAAVKKIEDQVKDQGGVISEALAAEGMTLDDLRHNIVIRTEIEKLVADKTNVADQEVDQYIKDNKVGMPKGEEAGIKAQIKTELKDQKITAESKILISDLKAKAKIKYFVAY